MVGKMRTDIACHLCWICGKSLLTYAPQAVYCGEACRAKAYRRRRDDMVGVR